MSITLGKERVREGFGLVKKEQEGTRGVVRIMNNFDDVHTAD